MKSPVPSETKCKVDLVNAKSNLLVVSVFESELGWIAFVAVNRVLKQLSLGNTTRVAAMRNVCRNFPRVELDDDVWPELMTRLQAFAIGRAESFSDVKIDCSHLTPFEQRVVEQCRRIPYGQTLSYGQLAARAGVPGAARAVGNVMAGNRYPLVVPCHRVIHASGSVGRFTCPGGQSMKMQLLMQEGVRLSGKSTYKMLPRRHF